MSVRHLRFAGALAAVAVWAAVRAPIGGAELSEMEKWNPMYRMLNPSIKVALTQDSLKGPQYERMIKDAIMAWVDPLREMSPYPLAKEVEFIHESKGVRGPRDDDYPPDQSKADLTVIISPHDVSGSGGGLEVLASADPRYVYSTLVHEFGHAFGLPDRYGEWGDDPNSIMGKSHLSRPQPSDLAEHRGNFRQMLKDMGPGDVPGSLASKGAVGTETKSRTMSGLLDALLGANAEAKAKVLDTPPGGAVPASPAVDKVQGEAVDIESIRQHYLDRLDAGDLDADPELLKEWMEFERGLQKGGRPAGQSAKDIDAVRRDYLERSSKDINAAKEWVEFEKERRRDEQGDPSHESE